MKKKVFLILTLQILVCLIFIGRLAYMQIIEDKYKLQSASISRRAVTLYPGRGYIYDRNQKLLVANQVTYDLMITPSKVRSLDTSEFCRLLGISKASFLDRLSKSQTYSMHKSSLFLGEISKENHAFFQEFAFNYKGFYTQRRSTRAYPYFTGANVLGYIGEVTTKQAKQFDYYEKGDMIGVAGLEKSYEKILRGARGVQYLLVDALSRTKGSLKKGTYDRMPIQGKSITTSLDIDLQKYGEKLLGSKRGAIVAIEPSSGEILVMASKPNFDPKLLIGRNRTRNYQKLLQDTVEKPLFDRSILGEYPPGSPFKLITGLIGLQEQVLTPEKKYSCQRGFYSGNRFVKCHCRSSTSNLITAISRSCNTYFSNVYRTIIEKTDKPSEGMERWRRHIRSFGLGRYLGNDLPTGRKGFIPGADYYDKTYGKGRWKASYNISNAFGQGEISTTPLQMANMTAAIANRGFFYIPHMIKKISGSTELIPKKFTKPHFTSVESSMFPVVIEGMHRVLQPKGTAGYLAIPGIEMCGKTGTSQNPHGQDHSIFIAFAPKKKPKIALFVIVENGYWGARWAGPIASLMVEKYLTGKTKRNWLEQRMIDGVIDYSEQPSTPSHGKIRQQHNP